MMAKVFLVRRRERVHPCFHEWRHPGQSTTSDTDRPTPSNPPVALDPPTTPPPGHQASNCALAVRPRVMRYIQLCLGHEAADLMTCASGLPTNTPLKTSETMTILPYPVGSQRKLGLTQNGGKKGATPPWVSGKWIIHTCLEEELRRAICVGMHRYHVHQVGAPKPRYCSTPKP
jgi:hypothetical protein